MALLFLVICPVLVEVSAGQQCAETEYGFGSS
jgi:hypothetical protein